MHLRPCLGQPLSYSDGFSLVSWDPSPHLGTTLKMPLLGHWLICGIQEGMQRDISPTFLLQNTAAHTNTPRPPEPFSLGYGKQRGLGCDIPDLDAPVHGDRGHLLAVRVKAACCDGPFVMIYT